MQHLIRTQAAPIWSTPFEENMQEVMAADDLLGL